MLEQSINFDNKANSCVHETTLGKRRSFKWRLDDQGNLQIHRQFKHQDAFRPVQTNFSTKQLDQISEYAFKKKEIILDNNVALLELKDAEDGLGPFIYSNFGKTTSDAQASSHLAALFVKAKIWQLHKGRGMSFLASDSNWKEKIRDYYNRGLNGVITP